MRLKRVLLATTAVLALFAANGSVASAELEVQSPNPPEGGSAVVSTLTSGSGKVAATAVPEPAIAIIGAVGVMLLVRKRSVGSA